MISPISGWILASGCIDFQTGVWRACCFIVIPLTLVLDDLVLQRFASLSFALSFYGKGTCVIVSSTNGELVLVWIGCTLGLTALHFQFIMLLVRLCNHRDLHVGLLLGLAWPIFEFVRYLVTKLADGQGMRILDLGLVATNGIYIGQLVGIFGVPFISMLIAVVSGCLIEGVFQSRSVVLRLLNLSFAMACMLAALVGGSFAYNRNDGQRKTIPVLLAKTFFTKSTLSGLKIAHENRLDSNHKEGYKDVGSTIVLFPESAMDWYLDPPPNIQQQELQEAILRWTSEEPIWIGLGVNLYRGDKWANCCLVIHNGLIQDIIFKKHLVPILELESSLLNHLTSRDKLPSTLVRGNAPVIHINDVVVSDEENDSDSKVPFFPSICFDMFFSESYVNAPSSSVMLCGLLRESADKTGVLQSLSIKHARLRAIENQLPFAHVAIGGSCTVILENGDFLPQTADFQDTAFYRVPLLSFRPPVQLGYGSVAFACTCLLALKLGSVFCFKNVIQSKSVKTYQQR